MGAFGGVAAPAIGQSARTLRFGHNMPVGIIFDKAARMFGDELAQLSSNKLKVAGVPKLAARTGAGDAAVRAMQARSTS